MRYFTLFPLNGYWGKWLGGGIIFLALVMGVVVIGLGSSFLDTYMEPEQQKALIAWLLAGGLYQLSLSKEKVDDERVQRIRYVAFRATFFFVFMFPLLVFFMAIWEGSHQVLFDRSELPELILLFLVVPLVIFQIIFNLGLRLDPGWAYNDLDAEENIKKNPLFRKYLVLVLLALAGLILYRLFQP